MYSEVKKSSPLPVFFERFILHKKTFLIKWGERRNVEVRRLTEKQVKEKQTKSEERGSPKQA
jgi:hypothetical protein